MAENTILPAVHDKPEEGSPSPEANGTALTEVNGNVMADGRKDAAVKPLKQVNWGGDTNEASDGENKNPNDDDQPEGGAVVAVKKKKRKSKSKAKRGLVETPILRISPMLMISNET